MSLDASTLGLEEIQRQTQESPKQELLRRYADQSPTWLMPRLYAIQQTGQMWEDARQRLIDDHICELRAKGAEDLVDTWLKQKQTDMGAISVTGDTYHVQPAPAQAAGAGTVGTVPGTGGTQTTPANGTAATTPNKPGVLSSLLWPAVIAAGTLGAGGAGLAAYNWYTGKPNVTNISQTGDESDWKLGIKVQHGPPESK